MIIEIELAIIAGQLAGIALLLWNVTEEPRRKNSRARVEERERLKRHEEWRRNQDAR